MKHLNRNRTGLILGSFFGLYHLTWSLLVAIGWAQPLLDWVFYLHFLNNPFRVAAFNVGTAIVLVGITSTVGFIMGWVIALLWNVFHSRSRD